LEVKFGNKRLTMSLFILPGVFVGVGMKLLYKIRNRNKVCLT